MQFQIKIRSYKIETISFQFEAENNPDRIIFLLNVLIKNLCHISKLIELNITLFVFKSPFSFKLQKCIYHVYIS